MPVRISAKKFMHVENPSAFTLVESLVVISILSVIAGSVFIGLRGAREQGELREARATLVHALESARSRAATGFGTSSHGVHIDGSSVVLFEGAVYVPGSGVEYMLPGFLSVTPSTDTIIFSRLSAHASTDAVITLLAQSGISETVTVSEDGAIVFDE